MTGSNLERSPAIYPQHFKLNHLKFSAKLANMMMSKIKKSFLPEKRSRRNNMDRLGKMFKPQSLLFRFG